MHLCAVGAMTDLFEKRKKAVAYFPVIPQLLIPAAAMRGQWQTQHAGSLTHLENSYTSSLMSHLWEGSVILCPSTDYASNTKILNFSPVGWLW